MAKGMKCIDFTKETSTDKTNGQSMDETNEQDEFPKFQLNKLTHFRGCIWELLEGIEVLWLWKIKSRVKITQWDIIYIFTEKQIKEFNDMILKEIEPSEFENLENYYSNDLLITYERA